MTTTEEPQPIGSADASQRPLPRRSTSARSTPHRSASRRPPSKPVRARGVIDARSLADRGGVPAGSDDHLRAVSLLTMQKLMARQRAEQIELLAGGWVPEGPDDADDRDEGNLVTSIALRTTIGHAAMMLRDAHTAVTDLPSTYARLRTGDLPAEWFDRLLRSTRFLTSHQRREVDERVSRWQLSDIPPDRFRRELRYLVAWYERSDPQRTPESQRSVSLVPPVDGDGTASISITGPISEIVSLWNRLDACSRAVQDRQRLALEMGAPVPYDLDGRAAAEKSPLSLSALRYAVLTRTELDTGGIEVPTDRFRMNVVVPVLTLLGIDDAPALLDGTIPIPAQTARLLAAGEPLWHRVLTDPISGAFLPVASQTYRPTAAMIEQLRLRHPVCAAPGCTRSSFRVAEADHIEEFDHRDPARGGPTSIENLHLLCRTHHRLKTAGRIDPVRGPTPPGWVPGSIGTTIWTRTSREDGFGQTVVPDGIDPASMLMAHTLEILRQDWEDHVRHRDAPRGRSIGDGSDEPPEDLIPF